MVEVIHAQCAIVASRYNEDITRELYQGATEVLIENGVVAGSIHTAWVPGAVEIPIAAQWYARQSDISIVIALGAVIRGDSDHYEHVAHQVSWGCQHVALTHNKPVIFGVLTVHDHQQALDRIGGVCGHYGKEAALSALSMVHLSQTKLNQEAVCYDNSST